MGEAGIPPPGDDAITPRRDDGSGPAADTVLMVETTTAILEAQIGWLVSPLGIGLVVGAVLMIGSGLLGRIVLVVERELQIRSDRRRRAGAIEVTGLNYRHELGFSVGYGFDAIAIALLGKTHPLGVVLAALLFGAMRNGATRMQFLTQIPVDVISVIQALILLFVAADAIVRWIYRVRAREERVVLTRGWGG